MDPRFRGDDYGAGLRSRGDDGFSVPALSPAAAPAFCSPPSALRLPLSLPSLQLPASIRFPVQVNGDGAGGNWRYGGVGKVTGVRLAVSRSAGCRDAAFTSANSDRLGTTPGQVSKAGGGRRLRRGVGYRADAGGGEAARRVRRASQYTMQVAKRHATEGAPGDGSRGKVV
jgi:hypothetical protein